MARQGSTSRKVLQLLLTRKGTISPKSESTSEYPFEGYLVYQGQASYVAKNRSGASRLRDGTYLSKRQLNSLTIHIPCSCFRLALLPDFDRCRLVFQNISESRRVRRNIALELRVYDENPVFPWWHPPNDVDCCAYGHTFV